MDVPTIHRALRELNDELVNRDAQGEICLLGGTAMVLAFHARQTTKDVDAAVRAAAREDAVGTARCAVRETWLVARRTNFPAQTTRLGRRSAASLPRNRFGTRKMPSRIGSPGEADDQSDIRFLLNHLQIQNAAEALEIVSRYYPPERIPIRARYLLEEILQQEK